MRVGTRCAIVALVLTAVGGCSDDGGADVCVTSTDCRSTQRCVDGMCVERVMDSGGQDGAAPMDSGDVDASAVDASRPDAAPADASAVDARVDDAGGGIDARIVPTDSGPGITYTLTVITSGTAIGMVTSTPSGIDCPGTCETDFPAGLEVTLTQMAPGGTCEWLQPPECSGLTGDCTFVMNMDRTARAFFPSTPGVCP